MHSHQQATALLRRGSHSADLGITLQLQLAAIPSGVRVTGPSLPIASTSFRILETNMIKLHSFAYFATTILLIATNNTLTGAQTPSPNSQSASIVVTIGLDKDHVPVGQSPWAILTVKNLTDQEVSIHDSMIRLYVEGEKGERPTTRVQRSITGKLRPGEAPLRGDEYVDWVIPPGESSSHKYELSYFYDLSEPGKHKVHMDVADPSSRKWLRTNTAAFEMEAPN
jgi:hypothetical protein